MTDYTPTTEEVRSHYAVDSYSDIRINQRFDSFDRWLAEVKAQAWEEGNKAGVQNLLARTNPGIQSLRLNPYRKGENK